MQQPAQISSTELTTSKLFNLKAKVALITGASGALGTAVAQGLAVNGVDLVLSDLENDNLQRLSTEVVGLGAKVLPIHCDVTDESQVKAMVNEAIAEFGDNQVPGQNLAAFMVSRMRDDFISCDL